MLKRSEPLLLSSAKPLSNGSESVVYNHPDNPDWLVKVMVPSRQNKVGHKVAKWYKRLRRDKLHRFALRQVNEFMSYQYRGKAHLGILADFIGFASTDLGFGLIVRRIQDFDGTTSRTLEDVVKEEGLSDNTRALIESYCTLLIEHQIVMVDIRARNLLVVREEDEQRHLVAIDSFGERNLIPLATNIKWWNKRHIERHKQHLIEELTELDKAR